mgnify:CR=1 FL=1
MKPIIIVIFLLLMGVLVFAQRPDLGVLNKPPAPACRTDCWLNLPKGKTTLDFCWENIKN